MTEPQTQRQHESGTPDAGPLSPQHVQDLAQAKTRLRSVRRAAAVANFNGWMVGIAGLLCLLTGWGSAVAIATGVALCVLAWREHRGRAMLLVVDDRAPRWLAWNQVFIAVVVDLYCGWQMVEAIRGSSSSVALAAAGDPEVAQMLGGIEGLVSAVTIGVYGGAAVLTTVVQLGATWYYLSKRRHLAAFRATTPAWIVEAHRSGALG